MTDKSKKEQDIGYNPAQKRFIALVVTVVALFGPYTYCIVQIYKWNRVNAIQGHTNWVDLSQFWIPFVAAPIVFGIKNLIYHVSYQFFYDHCKEKDDEIGRRRRANKAAENLFSFLYHISTTCYSYYVLRDIDWFPWFYGGKGTLENGFTDMPFFTYRPGLTMYSLVTMGYYLGDFFVHIFVQQKMNDFEEMLLHHICTIILYGGCIVINNFVAGCCIMFLHDISDIFVALVKMVSETEASDYSALCMVFTLLSWAYFRVLSFPVIIYQLHSNWTFPDEIMTYGNVLKYTVTFFLSCLVLLHVYWLYLMLQMIVHYLQTGASEDTQNQSSIDRCEIKSEQQKLQENKKQN